MQQQHLLQYTVPGMGITKSVLAVVGKIELINTSH